VTELKLTHLDETGAARMVDVGAKPHTERVALAESFIRMQPQTLAMILTGGHKKGDVLPWRAWRELWLPKKPGI